MIAELGERGYGFILLGEGAAELYTEGVAYVQESNNDNNNNNEIIKLPPSVNLKTKKSNQQ